MVGSGTYEEVIVEGYSYMVMHFTAWSTYDPDPSENSELIAPMTLSAQTRMADNCDFTGIRFHEGVPATMHVDGWELTLESKP
jgi:hypothetical protein